jgi:hypothetical protein
MMIRRVILPGLFGGLVMVSWTIVVNGIFGFRAGIDMNQVPNERQIYDVLKQSIMEPGRYMCNPAVTDAGNFPGGEPVFGISYGGVGHDAAGALALFQLPLFFILPILATWMLSRSDNTVLSSYSRKVLFFATVGLLIGIASYLTDFGIGGYPLDSAVVLSLNEVALWTVAGLVVAWRIKPDGT